MPELDPGPQYETRPVRVVHLRRAEYDDTAVRASWQAAGYATMGPVEGHDPYRRCPHCSTDQLLPCPLCGREVEKPCALLRWLLGVTDA